MTLARVDNTPCRKTDEFSLDVSERRPVNVLTSLMCHLKRPLRSGGYLCNQIQQNNFEMFKFKRTMLSNVLTAKAISRAMLSGYLTRYIKNIYSVATTPLQFRNGIYNFVTELSHLMCHVFAKFTFWHKKYELSLTIDIGLLHMYHLSVLPPKQHNIPLIVSRQISTPYVSPNLTDAHLVLFIR